MGGKGLMPQDNFTLPDSTTDSTVSGPSVWLLKTSIIGSFCIAHWGKAFTDPVGGRTCVGQQYYDETKGKTLWMSENSTSLPDLNPFSRFPTSNHSWYQLEALTPGKHPQAFTGSAEREQIDNCLPNGQELVY